jgi:Dual OB-containing domain
MPIKRIVCLANSRKLLGRCVAGREIVGSQVGDWVRPVGAGESAEVSEHERQYEDGSDPQVLDMIEVPLIKPKPKHFQQENWLLDREYYWTRIGRMNWTELVAIVENPALLWINESSTYNGFNDQISVETAQQLTSSLVLLRVDQVKLRVFQPGAAFGDTKRRVQAQFVHREIPYWLFVTDPVIERTYKAYGEGNYEIGECCLTISIGEPYKGYCYKLVAAIIIKE